MSYLIKPVSGWLFFKSVYNAYSEATIAIDDWEACEPALNNEIQKVEATIGGLQKDLKVIEHKTDAICSAKGTSSFNNGIIIVAPKFHLIDKEAFNFVLKHEFGHIYHDDMFKVHALAAGITAVASVYSFFSESSGYVTLGSLIALFFGNVISYTQFKLSSLPDSPEETALFLGIELRPRHR